MDTVDTAEADIGKTAEPGLPPSSSSPGSLRSLARLSLTSMSSMSPSSSWRSVSGSATRAAPPSLSGLTQTLVEVMLVQNVL